MPVLTTDTARSRYLGMVGRYLRATPRRPARPDAARRPIETDDTVMERIAGDPGSRLTHPGPYPERARYRCRWIELHRYWFAWLPGPSPVIANIRDEAGEIPRWVSDDDVPADVA